MLMHVDAIYRKVAKTDHGSKWRRAKPVDAASESLTLEHAWTASGAKRTPCNATIGELLS